MKKAKQTTPSSRTSIDDSLRGDLVEFLNGGSRESLGKFDFSLICPEALRVLAQVYHEGEYKYPFKEPGIRGSTYVRGLPWGDTINHMMNHLEIARSGGNNEGGPIIHLAKVAWGCFTLIHFCVKCKHHRTSAQLEAKVRLGWDSNYGKETNNENV